MSRKHRTTSPEVVIREIFGGVPAEEGQVYIVRRTELPPEEPKKEPEAPPDPIIRATAKVVSIPKNNFRVIFAEIPGYGPLLPVTVGKNLNFIRGMELPVLRDSRVPGSPWQLDGKKPRFRGKW